MVARSVKQPSGLIATLAKRWIAQPDEVPRPPDLGELNVTALPDGKWCVRDDRYHADDAEGLLGFIEEITGEETVFEVMALHGGFEWCSFPSFTEAIESFLEPRQPGVPR